MTRQDIEDKICDILMDNGDGHVDGYEEIVEYIMTIVDPRLINRVMEKYKITPLTPDECYEQ